MTAAEARLIFAITIDVILLMLHGLLTKK
jgi:hypothetical protein